MLERRLGTSRLYCPETVNWLAALSASRVAAVGYATTFVWDHTTGELVETLPRGTAAAARFAEDGRLEELADPAPALPLVEHASSGGRVRARWPSGAVIEVTRPGKLVRAAAAADVARLAVGDGDTIDVLGAGGEVIATVPGSTRDLALSPDGRWLAFAPTRRIRVLDLTTGELRFAEDGDGTPHDLAFARDGRLAATEGGGVRIWTVDDARSTFVPGAYGSPAFAPDGSLVASTERRKGLGRWSPGDGTEVTHVSTPMRIESLAVGGWRAAYSMMDVAGLWAAPSGDVGVVDLRTGGPIAWIEGDDVEGYPVVELSPDGALLVACFYLVEQVRVWDLSAGKPVRVQTRSSPSRVARFSPDGARVAFADDEGLEVLDCATGRIERLATAEPSFAWTPDGRLLHHAPRGRLVERDASTLAEVSGIELELGPGLLDGLAVSPDGCRVATASGDGTVAIWRRPHGALR
jgi:WD40 repeat protein